MNKQTEKTDGRRFARMECLSGRGGGNYTTGADGGYVGTAAIGCPASEFAFLDSEGIPELEHLLDPSLVVLKSKSRSFAPRTAEGGCPHIVPIPAKSARKNRALSGRGSDAFVTGGARGQMPT